MHSGMITEPAFIATTPLRLLRCSSSRSRTSARRDYRSTRRGSAVPCMAGDGVRKCARCGQLFRQSENTASSCFYHGDVLGNVMLLNLYEDHHYDDAALDGVKGPRYGRRWACCQDTDPDAPPCKMGFHVTYDCGPERWREGVGFAVK